MALARVVLLSGALLAGGVYGQQPRRQEFETASVKPTALDPSQVGGLAMSGQVKFGPQIHGKAAEYLHMTLRQLVAEAYQVQPFQIVCPDWFLQDRFDIVARMPAADRAEDARVMLQSLLEDRFQLAMHWESREEAVAALIVAPGGPKLKESASENRPDPAADKKQPNRFGGMMGNVAVRFTVNEANSSVRFEASRITMADLARFLMNFGAGNGRPVVDLTGLKGAYEIALDIPLSMFGLAANDESGGAGADARTGRPAEYASDPGTGTVTRSLRRHGLDVKNIRAPVEHLVVDRAERKPIEN